MVMVTTVNTYKYHAGKNGQRSLEQDGDGSFDYMWLLNVMFVENRLNRVKFSRVRSVSEGGYWSLCVLEQVQRRTINGNGWA